MNANNQEYNPAEDENQGIITKMTQSEVAGSGVAQAEYMNPVVNQGPEPEKAEVDDRDDGLPDADSNGVNDDLLAEAAVEDGEAETDTETDE